MYAGAHLRIMKFMARCRCAAATKRKNMARWALGSGGDTFLNARQAVTLVCAKGVYK